MVLTAYGMIELPDQQGPALRIKRTACSTRTNPYNKSYMFPNSESQRCTTKHSEPTSERTYAHGRLDDLRPSCHPLTRPTLLAPTFQNTPSSIAKQRNAALLLQLHLRHRRRPPRSLFRVKQHRRGRTKIRTHAPQGLSVGLLQAKPGLMRGHRSRFDTMQKDLGDNEVLRVISLLLVPMLT